MLTTGKYRVGRTRLSVELPDTMVTVAIKHTGRPFYCCGKKYKPHRKNRNLKRIHAGVLLISEKDLPKKFRAHKRSFRITEGTPAIEYRAVGGQCLRCGQVYLLSEEGYTIKPAPQRKKRSSKS